MARKYDFCRQYGSFLLYGALVTGFVAGLVVLQQLCMNNDDDAFVSSVCLSDSNTRVILAAIITVIIALLNRAVTDAIGAYRVAQLASGINEGVYIAMGSTNPYYRLRALKTPWWAVMALFILVSHSPASLQTVANLFIKTRSVYVKAESTGQVYVGYSYYNVSAIPPGNSKQGSVTSSVANKAPAEGGVGLPNAAVSQLPQQHNLSSAFDVLAQGLQYSYTGSSTRGSDGQVTTTVIRNGYLTGAVFKTLDVSLSIQNPETVGLVSTLCSTGFIAASLQNVLTSTSVHFNLSDGSAGATDFKIVVLDATGNISSDAVLLFRTSAVVGDCFGCAGGGLNGTVIGQKMNCTHTVQFQEQEIIYRVSTGGITPFRLINSSTTVQSAVAEVFIAAFVAVVIGGPIAIQNTQFTQGIVQSILDTNFVQGYFSVGTFNFLHTTVCSAVSQTLGRLWTIAQGPNAVLSTVPLYGVELQTYVSSRAIAVFSTSVVTAALLVCILGSAYTHVSPINIKDATENALVENLTMELIKRKSDSPTSNDPAMQRENAFKHTDGLPVTLYCRECEYVDRNRVVIRKVSIGYDASGVRPGKSTDYS